MACESYHVFYMVALVSLAVLYFQSASGQVLSTTCTCNYNFSLSTCACCEEGSCQCPQLSPTSPQTCVTCGEEDTCDSDIDRDCAIINSEGCFFPEIEPDARPFSEAGRYCAEQGGHLPNFKLSGEAWRDYSRSLTGGNDLWTGARIRQFDWTWSATNAIVKLQGCFLDNQDLPQLAYTASKHENVTAESCIAECRHLGYTYAGVQFETASTGEQALTPCCRCAEVVGQQHEVMYTESELERCETPCLADSDQLCGAIYRHLLFHEGGTEFEAWNRTEKPEYDNHCAQLHVPSSTWLKSNCSTRVNYICQHPGMSEEECYRDGHEWAEERCVSVHEASVTWQRAMRLCADIQKGSTLVELSSAVMQAAVVAATAGMETNYWIGLTNRPITWTDGSAVTHVRWMTGEPQFSGYRVCVKLDRENIFQARLTSCSNPNRFLCQHVYEWTDDLYEDYIYYYDSFNDTGTSQSQSSSPSPPNKKRGQNSKENGSPELDTEFYIAIGVGVGIAVIVIILFVIYIIYHRKSQYAKEKLSNDYYGHSNGGFSGPGLTRDGTYRLTRRDTVYESIDDTYQRPEHSRAHDAVEGYTSLTNSSTATDHPLPEVSQTPPELPPMREDGYAGLRRPASEMYTKPMPYATLMNSENDSAYTGLRDIPQSKVGEISDEDKPDKHLDKNSNVEMKDSEYADLEKKMSRESFIDQDTGEELNKTKQGDVTDQEQREMDNTEDDMVENQTQATENHRVESHSIDTDPVSPV